MSIPYSAYRYQGGLSPVEEQVYEYLHALRPTDIEASFTQIKNERWSAFWKKQKNMVYFVVFGAVSWLLITVSPLFGLGVLWGFGAMFSILASAISYQQVINKECNFLRTSYKLSKAALTYQDYARAHLEMIAKKS